MGISVHLFTCNSHICLRTDMRAIKLHELSSCASRATNRTPITARFSPHAKIADRPLHHCRVLGAPKVFLNETHAAAFLRRVFPPPRLFVCRALTSKWRRSWCVLLKLLCCLFDPEKGMRMQECPGMHTRHNTMCSFAPPCG